MCVWSGGRKGSLRVRVRWFQAHLPPIVAEGQGPVDQPGAGPGQERAAAHEDREDGHHHQREAPAAVEGKHIAEQEGRARGPGPGLRRRGDGSLRPESMWVCLCEY